MSDPLFSALKNRNYRIYITGQFISFIGTWMQQMATGWLVFRLTKSAFWLGVSGFSSQIPMFLFAFFAGVFVDRKDKYKILIVTQTLAAGQALLLALLTYLGKINLPQLIMFNLFLGLVNAFDMTARQAFIVQMVKDRADLPNAIAINSTVINATRLIGPAVAGVAISAFGESFCFLINGISYIAVLIALAIMKIEKISFRQAHPSLKESLKIGFTSTFKDESIRSIILFLSFMSLVGLPFNAIFPALAAAQAGGGANTLGWITSATGFGALIGALYLARRSGPPLLGRRVAKSALQFSVALVAIAFAWRLGALLFFLAVAGMGMMIMLAGSNTVIQTVVDDDKRGRVMSFFNFSLLGISPFGNLLFGSMVQKFGLKHTFFIHGLICVVGSLIFFRKAEKINEYIKKKLTPAAVGA